MFITLSASCDTLVDAKAVINFALGSVYESPAIKFCWCFLSTKYQVNSPKLRILKIIGKLNTQIWSLMLLVTSHKL